MRGKIGTKQSNKARRSVTSATEKASVQSAAFVFNAGEPDVSSLLVACNYQSQPARHGSGRREEMTGFWRHIGSRLGFVLSSDEEMGFAWDVCPKCGNRTEHVCGMGACVDYCPTCDGFKSAGATRKR